MYHLLPREHPARKAAPKRVAAHSVYRGTEQSAKSSKPTSASTGPDSTDTPCQHTPCSKPSRGPSIARCTSYGACKALPYYVVPVNTEELTISGVHLEESHVSTDFPFVRCMGRQTNPLSLEFTRDSGWLTMRHAHK